MRHWVVIDHIIMIILFFETHGKDAISFCAIFIMLRIMFQVRKKVIQRGAF